MIVEDSWMLYDRREKHINNVKIASIHKEIAIFRLYEVHLLEQQSPIKCHQCGNDANFAFAYARFSAREAFLGVIYRGVCRECLRAYIEEVQNDRHLRGELLLWPIVLLPLGALLAALSQSEIVQSIGFFLLALAIVIPIFMRLLQKRESIAARRASEAQNEARYSEPMCREDALSTSRQTKLIYLCPEYGAEGADIAMIARDTGVALETARLIQKLSAAAQQFLREPTKTRIPFASFDKSDAL